MKRILLLQLCPCKIKNKTDNVKEKVKKSIEILVNENLATLMTKLVNENIELLKLG